MQDQGQGQGQGSSSNSFVGNVYFNAGNASNLHNMIPNGGHWIGQSNASLDTQNHISFTEFIGNDFWFSSPGDGAGGTSQRFEHPNEPSYSNPLLQNVTMMSSLNVNPFLDMNTPYTGHVNRDQHGPIGPSLLFPGQEGSLDLNQHYLDLNAVDLESSGNVSSQDNGPFLSLSGAGTVDLISTSHASSSPVMIYSGIAGYVLEENINGEGLPVDGQRRLLCKRRAPEFDYDNSSNSINASSSSHNRLNNSSSAGLVANIPAASNFHGVSNEVGQVHNFQRNTRLRTTANQPNHRTNLWTLNSSNNSSFQSTGQPMSGFCPFPQFTIANSPTGPVLVNPTMRPILQVSSPLQAPPQPSQYWNGTTMAWVNSSSSIFPEQTVSGTRVLRQEDYLRNNRINMMNRLANMQANLNLANGNANILGNIASPSTIQSTHPISSSLRSLQIMAARYAQRMQNIIDCAEASRQRGNYCPIHQIASPAVPGMEASMRGGNPRPAANVPLRIGSGSQRQAVRPSQVAPALLSQIAAQRRSRMVSGVRNALGLVRRPGGLQIEDVMVIDRSFLYGMPRRMAPDIHDDMRLDVDNMSYEELLDLEEQIGNVSTGLSEESVAANLRKSKYKAITIGPPDEAESCCICQEEYANGEELGKLDCSHDFHFSCIKQWLVQKNSCPICKKTALAI